MATAIFTLVLVVAPVVQAAASCFTGIETRMQQLVANGVAPGMAVRIDHRGQTVFDRVIGDLNADVTDERPLPADAIYRIYSMTKPITSVAALMLVEQDRLSLDDPVSKYLPHLSDLSVSTLTGTEPARQPITIRDLMRHTSGFTYGFFGFGQTRLAYQGADVGSWQDTNAELVDKLSKLPLEHQPGTVWEYSVSTDVLGRVIEVVTGRTLGAALHEMILDPLKMTDTHFRIPAADRDRIVNGTTPLPDYTEDRAFESGGGGLASTIDDYHRFTRMLRNGGELDGVRLLQPETVETMTRDHLFSAGLKKGKYFIPGGGHGFGLGVAVKLEQDSSGLSGPVGTYYWGGFAGTTFWVDPVNDLIVIVMIQTTSDRMLVRTAMRQAVYSVFRTDGTPGMSCEP
ncbi:serine hydrolase domain-containing protein [Minwuia sp.]|uniref:serine hydrolase domain-containing protein n=1 Tax=Minwuia sp. TaxID=2493630 RepID=UPI003A8FB179